MFHIRQRCCSEWGDAWAATLGSVLETCGLGSQPGRTESEPACWEDTRAIRGTVRVSEAWPAAPTAETSGINRVGPLFADKIPKMAAFNVPLKGGCERPSSPCHCSHKQALSRERHAWNVTRLNSSIPSESAFGVSTELEKSHLRPALASLDPCGTSRGQCDRTGQDRACSLLPRSLSGVPVPQPFGGDSMARTLLSGRPSSSSLLLCFLSEKVRTRQRRPGRVPALSPQLPLHLTLRT